MVLSEYYSTAIQFLPHQAPKHLTVTSETFLSFYGFNLQGVLGELFQQQNTLRRLYLQRYVGKDSYFLNIHMKVTT